MKKKWIIISRVISVILFMWSLYVLFDVTTRIYTNMHTGLRTGALRAENVGYGHLVKSFYIIYLTAFIALYAGIALMYEKKQGWIFAIIACMLYTGSMLISARNNLIIENTNKLVGVSYFGAALLFATMFILLVLKPFREKYRPAFKNWLFVGAIVGLIIVAKNIS